MSPGVLRSGGICIYALGTGTTGGFFIFKHQRTSTFCHIFCGSLLNTFPPGGGAIGIAYGALLITASYSSGKRSVC